MVATTMAWYIKGKVWNIGKHGYVSVWIFMDILVDILTKISIKQKLFKIYETT